MMISFVQRGSNQVGQNQRGHICPFLIPFVYLLMFRERERAPLESKGLKCGMGGSLVRTTGHFGPSRSLRCPLS
jgi:hypothetical protein